MILIATPTRDSITAGTTGDLIRLCRRHPDAKWMAPTGIYIGNLRQSAVMAAQQMGASHVLFIDSDMRFPEDALQRLILPDRDIVAANYVQRTAPQWWTARENGQWISSVGRRGFERVDAIGFGVVLIRLSVFATLARPWFNTPYEQGQHLGEDLYFCRLAKAAGIEILIDHDLSQSVKHSGSIEWGVSNAPVGA